MKRKISIMALSVILMIQPVFTVMADPVFSRTQEEWDKLRDNQLEFQEIQGLIEEYNATVLRNKIDYNQFRKDYGDTNNKVSEKYRSMAQEIESNLTTPDPDDFGYASALASRASSFATIENLRKTADTTLEDAQVQKLSYEMAKLQLVQVAENNMMTYFNNMLALDNAILNKEKADIDLQFAEARFLAGVSTKTTVLDAKEVVLKSTQEITTSNAEMESVKQKLIVMCGWTYQADAEIKELPEINLEERIIEMNLEKDIPKAIENNYILKVQLRKKENAKSSSQKEDLDIAISNTKAGIQTAMMVAYQNVISARDAYLYAESNASLQEMNFNNIVSKHNLGMASNYELHTQEILKKQTEIAKKQSKIALFRAINGYDWNIRGLAKGE